MSVAPNIRITEGGNIRVTSDGAVRVAGFYEVPEPLPIPVAVPDVYFPGIVVQANLDLAKAQFIADEGAIEAADQPAILADANVLLAAEVVASYVPTTQEPYPSQLPPYPAGLPRFPDSNPAPDGWSITTDEKVVRGGRL